VVVQTIEAQLPELAVAAALRVPGRDLVRFFLLGILGVAASNYLYYLAIQRTNVATAIILQYTAPVWVLLYTVARGAQRPSLRRSAAVGLAVMGCALAVGFVGSGGFRMDGVGVIAALLAAFSFAFYNVGNASAVVVVFFVIILALALVLLHVREKTKWV